MDDDFEVFSRNPYCTLCGMILNPGENHLPYCRVLTGIEDQERIYIVSYPPEGDEEGWTEYSEGLWTESDEETRSEGDSSGESSDDSSDDSSGDESE